jgi:hypothetical protein
LAASAPDCAFASAAIAALRRRPRSHERERRTVRFEQPAEQRRQCRQGNALLQVCVGAEDGGGCRRRSRGEHDDLGVGCGLADPLDRPVLEQLVLYDYRVRAPAAYRGQDLAPSQGLGDDLVAVVLEEPTHEGALDVDVARDQDADPPGRHRALAPPR